MDVVKRIVVLGTFDVYVSNQIVVNDVVYFVVD